MSKINKSLHVILSDVHVPFEDKEVCQLAFNFIKREKPGTVHLLGDICDFYTLSRFDKDPSRKLTLQDELDATKAWLGKLRKCAPKAKIIYSQGNHEARLTKHLKSKARELASLKSLNIPDLLGLDEYNISYLLEDDAYMIGNDITLVHGEYCRASGQTPKEYWLRLGTSVIMGHTHRLTTLRHTSKKGTKQGWENGCLCTMDPEYMRYPDWQQGWTVVQTCGDMEEVRQILVKNGAYMYNNKLYKVPAKE